MRVVERTRRYALDTIRLSRIAGSPVHRARFMLVRTLLVLRALAGRIGRDYAVCVSEAQRSFRFRVADTAELEVLREVFLDREYELDLPSDPDVIVDVGSNIGATVGFFRARYPEARIVGLEPDPRAFARLEANVAGLEGVTVLRLAAGGTNGRRRFFPAGSTWLSSLQDPANGGPPIEVETRTLDSLLDELGVERLGLLKIDAEGAEEEILPAFAGLASVGAIVGEIHPDVVDDPDGLLRLLDEHFDLAVARPHPERWRFRGVSRTNGPSRTTA